MTHPIYSSRNRTLAFIGAALAPFAVAGGLLALGVSEQTRALEDCNAGKYERCSQVAPTAAPKAVKLTNYEVCLKTQQDLIEFGGDPSEMDCEAVKNYKTPAQRIAAAGGQQRLIRGCEAILKPALNDPNSYRYLSGRITVPDQKTFDITVNYTATNAFGGRVQGTYACTASAA